MNSIIRTNFCISRKILYVRTFCSSEIPKNKIADLTTAHSQDKCGVIYDKKPFKLHLEANKNYCWCLCGKSKSQPLCDGESTFVTFRTVYSINHIPQEPTKTCTTKSTCARSNFKWRRQATFTCATVSRPRTGHSATELTRDLRNVALQSNQ